jgi:hypothetical protein
MLKLFLEPLTLVGPPPLDRGTRGMDDGPGTIFTGAGRSARRVS